MKRILVLTKRQYMCKDLLDDRFGRFREIPLELSRRGHQVNGLCLSYSARPEGWAFDGSVHWKSINVGGAIIPGLSRYISESISLAKRSDVIWACSDSVYGVIGTVISRMTGVPLVFDLYDNFESYLFAKLPVLNQIYRHAVRHSDAVTCISLPLTRLVKRYGRKEGIVLLENAVRKDLFRPMDKAAARREFNLPNDSLIIGTAGALTKDRGISTLFHAYEQLKEKHHDLHLAIAGPRDVAIRPKDRVHDMGVLPFERVPAFLCALDVGIICNIDSKFGNYCFPQKAREMMACNVPIVAAKVGTMKILFENHPEWLFEPDDPSHLANAIEFRLKYKSVDYGPIPSWSSAADILEGVFMDFA